MRSEELGGMGLCWKGDVMNSKKEKKNNAGILCYSGGVKEKCAAVHY